MKKNNFFILALAGLVMLGTSCDKNDPEGDKFSPLTEEQNKANIELTGANMLTEMKQMEQEPAMQANISLANVLAAGESSSDAWKKMDLENTLGFSHIFAAANRKGVDGMLKTMQIVPIEDPTTIQELYDELKGVLEWNAVDLAWDYTQGGDAIIIKFPAELNGTENNAVYTLTYVGYNGPHPLRGIEDGYDGDLPQNIKATLKVDGLEVSVFAFDVVYNTEGIPTSIESSYSMGAYVLGAKVTNVVNTSFAGETSFKKDGNIILRFAIDAAGNWTEANIEANTKYFYWEYDQETWEYTKVEVTSADDWEDMEIEIQSIVTEGNASFQIMNMEIAGHINIKPLADKLNAIDAQYANVDYYQEQVQAEIDAVNANATLHLQYADSKNLIAIVEAFWDEEMGDVNFRLVFADGSAQKLALYFGDDFDNVIEEYITYLESLEDSYDFIY